MVVTEDLATPNAAIAAPVTTLTCTNPTATLTASGGGTYEWSTTETTAAISVTTPDTYTVTVTSANGCTSTAEVTIDEDTTLPTVSIDASGTELTCTTTSVTLTAQTTETNIVWSVPGNFTTTNNPLTATAVGVYTVVVTAANGCTASATIDITRDITVPVVSIATPAVLTCNLTSTTLSATADPTYTYAWSTLGGNIVIDGNEATATPTVDAPGVYIVTVTGASGCTAQAIVQVNENITPPNANAGSDVVLACGVTTTTLTATGGGTYLWSNGETTATITDVIVGTYTVTVTAANGCTATDVVAVSAATACGSIGDYVWFDTNGDGIQNETPTDGLNGITVTLTLPDGSTITTVTTNNPTTGEPGWYTFDNLPAGNYTVTIGTGPNGSELTTPGVINVVLTDGQDYTDADFGFTELGSIGDYVWFDTNGDGIQNETPTDGLNGITVTLTLPDGSTITTVTTNNPTTGEPGWYTFDNLPAGDYTVTVGTGPNGSTLTTPGSFDVTLTQGEDYVDADFGFMNCGANVSDIPDQEICEGDLAIDGTLTFPLEPYSTIYGPEPSPAASYTLAYVLTTDSDVIIATEVMGAPFNTVSNTPNFTYSNLADGVYRMYEIIYRTSDGPLTGLTVGSTISGIGLTTGTCLDATYGNIYVNAQPIPQVINNNPIVCEGSDVILVAGGGISYQWEYPDGTIGTSTTAPLLTISNATMADNGTYTVTVTNADGCTASTTTTVTVNALPTPSVNDGNMCPGGSATLSTTTAYSAYLWSNGSTTATISVSPANTTIYSVTVTDANGCQSATTGTVTVSSNLVANISTPNGTVITCATTPTLVASATGATSYAWSSGESTANITATTAGTYTVTVTATGGCTATASVTITENITAPFAVISTPQGTSLTCTQTSLDLSANAFPAGVTYSWSNGTTTANTTASVAGTYTVTVTNPANGCSTTTSVVITSSGSVSVSIATPATLTCSTTGVTLTATGIGATNYSWSNGSTTASTTVTTAGDYTVTVTNGSCSSTAVVTVLGDTNPPANVSAGADQTITCTTTSVTLSATTSTTSSVTYAWSNGATTASTTVSTAGNYTVTVTAANGCTATDVVNVGVDNSIPNASIAASATNLDCNTSSITLTASPASGVSYAWSTTENTASITVTSAGTYTVTVTAANGCSSIVTQNIGSINSINASLVIDEPLCNGGTGSVDVTVSGGVTPYNYDWSNGATTQDLSGVLAGTYTVTISDSNNPSCTVMLTATVNEPIRLGLTAATTPATCGANNGTVDLSVTGGTGTLSYFWSNGATTQDLSGVAAGTYFVIVSDANGCSSSASAQVTTPNGLTVNLGANGIDNISCNGLTNGAIDIAISGGTTPYNVLWSNGATTQDLSGLSAGDYEVTVTDASGCSAILFATITEPTALNASTAITPEICGDGAINLSVGGGTINYSYNWSNGASTQDISNLNAGTYTVTVTDANGCTVISTANVNQTPLPANNDGPACEQGTITIGFGTAGEVGEVINYVWSGPNGYSNSGSFVSDGSDIITADLNNLSLQDAGLYSVTVTFANGCTRTANTLVKVNGLPIISDIITTCNGTIATITVIASSNPNGNAVEYSIDGINYQTSNVFTGVVNGSYKIYVRDVVTGCVTETDITVNCVACPIPVASNSGPACVGQPLSLSVNPNLPTGVTATYLWTKQGSTATSTAQNPNLGSATIGKAGTYVVQVTYSNGCVATASTIVVVNPLPTATASVVCNGTTGTITVTANAGGAAIVYSLTGAPGTFQTGNVFTNVPNGTYNIVVRNNTTGCTRTVPVTVNCNACPVAVAANSGPVCPGSSLSLTVNPNLPTGVTATYAWSGPAGTSTLQNPTIPNMTPAKAGIYTTTVTYSNGCTSVASTNVVVSPKPTVNAIASCDPATGGIITITATGGSGFTYNWNGNSQDSNVFTSVPNGNGYVVTVTNSAGCSGTANVTVSCVTCQAAVGAVTITSGGCSGEQISATGIFNSPSTGYANYLLLTDAQGNILEVQAAPSATFAYSAMGGVTYNVYAYSVKTPNGGPNPPAVGSNVSAISGSCFDLSDGTQYDNIVPAPPMFDSSLNTQEGNNGGITPFEYNTDIITVEGGTLPYDFVWDNTGYVRYDIVYSDNVDANGDGSTMPGAIITIYYTDDAQWNVTITDQSGCAENEVLSTNSFNSGANAILDIDAFETFSCSDINGADGSIELTITGGDTGCGEFQYEWFGPEGWDGVASGLTATGNGSFVGTSSAPINNYTLTNLPTGWYSVVITDCAGNVTEGWYWVPLGTRGRTKVDATALLSVQPNPFANQTQVTFTTEGATQATVMVYTVDGKLVSTLFKGAVQDKQTYSVPFDGANLPTGVYMIQMVTDNDISKFEKVIIAR